MFCKTKVTFQIVADNFKFTFIICSKETNRPHTYFASIRGIYLIYIMKKEKLAKEKDAKFKTKERKLPHNSN